MGRLNNRVAIITGGAGYLGGAYAVHMARDGASIVVADVADGTGTVSAIKEEGGEAIWVETDVTDPRATERMAQAAVERFGRIDILVNNAAIIGESPKFFTDISLAEWQRNLDVDLTGMFLCAQAVFPAMKKAGYGRIVNISSCRMLVGGANQLHYVSAKAGVVGLTRALATEVGDFGVCVNTILPGLYLHEMGGREMGGRDMNGRAEERRQEQALKRLGRPVDIAPAGIFFASEEARFITGQALAVDGGLVRTGG
jgi:3-oxoacyl-[acyl-carrier protein] reductase